MTSIYIGMNVIQGEDGRSNLIFKTTDRDNRDTRISTHRIDKPINPTLIEDLTKEFQKNLERLLK